MELDLVFQVQKDGKIPGELIKSAEFYEGYIKVDAILGHDWLENGKTDDDGGDTDVDKDQNMK